MKERARVSAYQAVWRFSSVPGRSGPGGAELDHTDKQSVREALVSTLLLPSASKLTVFQQHTFAKHRLE